MRAIMPASAASQLFERSGSSVGQNTGLSRRGSRVRAPSAPPAFFEKCKQPSRWNGAVVQLVRIPACHAGGRGFEPRPLRHLLRATGKTEKPPSRWFFCAHVCGHALLLCPNAVLCLNAAFVPERCFCCLCAPTPPAFRARPPETPAAPPAPDAPYTVMPQRNLHNSGRCSASFGARSGQTPRFLLPRQSRGWRYSFTQ